MKADLARDSHETRLARLGGSKVRLALTRTAGAATCTDSTRTASPCISLRLAAAKVRFTATRSRADKFGTKLVHCIKCMHIASSIAKRPMHAASARASLLAHQVSRFAGSSSDGGVEAGAGEV